MIQLIRWYLKRRRETAGGPGVEIRTYKGERRAQRDMERMLALGYRVQDHNIRKARYGLLAGVFTRKQIHTVTYVR